MLIRVRHKRNETSASCWLITIRTNFTLVLIDLKYVQRRNSLQLQNKVQVCQRSASVQCISAVHYRVNLHTAHRSLSAEPQSVKSTVRHKVITIDTPLQRETVCSLTACMPHQLYCTPSNLRPNELTLAMLWRLLEYDHDGFGFWTKFGTRSRIHRSTVYRFLHYYNWNQCFPIVGRKMRNLWRLSNWRHRMDDHLGPPVIMMMMMMMMHRRRICRRRIDRRKYVNPSIVSLETIWRTD